MHWSVRGGRGEREGAVEYTQKPYTTHNYLISCIDLKGNYVYDL